VLQGLAQHLYYDFVEIKVDYVRTNTKVKLGKLGIMARDGHEKMGLVSNIDINIDNAV